MKNIENHSDYKNLFKSFIIPKLDENIELHHTPTTEYSLYADRCHIRIPLQIYWTDKMISNLKKRFDKLNEATQELNFNFISADDFDEDPGERTWDPRINFTITHKSN